MASQKKVKTQFVPIPNSMTDIRLENVDSIAVKLYYRLYMMRDFEGVAYTTLATLSKILRLVKKEVDNSDYIKDALTSLEEYNYISIEYDGSFNRNTPLGIIFSDLATDGYEQIFYEGNIIELFQKKDIPGARMLHMYMAILRKHNLDKKSKENYELRNLFGAGKNYTEGLECSIKSWQGRLRISYNTVRDVVKALLKDDYITVDNQGMFENIVKRETHIFKIYNPLEYVKKAAQTHLDPCNDINPMLRNKLIENKVEIGNWFSKTFSGDLVPITHRDMEIYLIAYNRDFIKHCENRIVKMHKLTALGKLEKAMKNIRKQGKPDVLMRPIVERYEETKKLIETDTQSEKDEKFENFLARVYAKNSNNSPNYDLGKILEDLDL